MSLHAFLNKQICIPPSTFFSRQDNELKLRLDKLKFLTQKHSLKLKLRLPMESSCQLSFPVFSVSKLDRKNVPETRFVSENKIFFPRRIQFQHKFPRATQKSFAGSGLNQKFVDPLDKKVESAKEILKEDLPRQYDGEINWDVYSDNVVFVDPVTRLQGKFLYRGMIGTIRALSMTIFQTGTSFVLHSIDEVDANASTTSQFSPRKLEINIFPERALRTVWATKAQSRWGTDLFISGDDIFRFDKNGLIITHESAWNEDPTIVWDQLRP